MVSSKMHGANYASPQKMGAGKNNDWQKGRKSWRGTIEVVWVSLLAVCKGKMISLGKQMGEKLINRRRALWKIDVPLDEPEYGVHWDGRPRNLSEGGTVQNVLQTIKVSKRIQGELNLGVWVKPKSVGKMTTTEWLRAKTGNSHRPGNYL